MPRPLIGWGFSLKGIKMEKFDIKAGYVYHIKDLYFETVKDSKLMQNHEGGANRPTYLCVKDIVRKFRATGPARFFHRLPAFLTKAYPSADYGVTVFASKHTGQVIRCLPMDGFRDFRLFLLHFAADGIDNASPCQYAKRSNQQNNADTIV